MTSIINNLDRKENKMNRNSFVAIALAIFFAPSCVYAAKTIFVPRDHAVIQDAIRNAEDGDTVRVASGTYSSFRVGKNIRVIGEDRSNTIINNLGEIPVIFQNRNGASIENFTIKGGGGIDPQHKGAIIIIDSEGVTIENCTIRESYVAFDYRSASGVSMYSSEATILDCLIEDNVGQEMGGIYCSGNSNLTMKNTVVRNNKSTDRGRIFHV